MKDNQFLIAACIIVVALIAIIVFVITGITSDRIPQEQLEKIPENADTGNSQPAITIRENTTFIDIHHKDGRRALLYAEDPEYPAIEAECLEQIHCINAQIKTGFSRAKLDAMKHNGTYVAINFPVPTTFETSYIVDGSPKMITIDEAIFFLDSEYEDIIITPMLNGPGVWDTSRDRVKLRELIDPVFQSLLSEKV